MSGDREDESSPYNQLYDIGLSIMNRTTLASMACGFPPFQNKILRGKLHIDNFHP
jgi:hypothetical protein